MMIFDIDGEKHPVPAVVTETIVSHVDGTTNNVSCLTRHFYATQVHIICQLHSKSDVYSGID